MSVVLQHRRGTAADRVALTLSNGELFFDESTKKTWIGDGAIVGGLRVDGARLNAQTGATYAIQPEDAGKLTTFNHATAVAVSIAQAGSTGGTFWPNQDRGWFLNLGVGTVTITPATSQINGAASIALTNGESCCIFSDGANYFALISIAAVSTSLAALTDVSLTSPVKGQRLVYNGSVWVNQNPVKTLTKTTSYNIAVTDDGLHLNNVGAGGNITLTLPTAAVDLSYGALVDAAHTVTLAAQSGEFIAVGGVNSSSGGNWASNLPYSFLEVECHKTGQWIATSMTGSWTPT